MRFGWDGGSSSPVGRPENAPDLRSEGERRKGKGTCRIVEVETRHLIVLINIWTQRLLRALPAVLLFIVAAPAFAQQGVIELDPSRTLVHFTLGSTLHAVHGSFKLKSARIICEPGTDKISGVVVVDAASGESGNDGRDAKMHREILESRKYPEITFTPLQLQEKLALQEDVHIEVRGIFKLHGQDHEIVIPVAVRFQANQFTLDANFPVPYIKWGLKNPSTFILRASDTAQVTVHAVGQLATAAAN
jgi:polyisoprenoid-binding protein YceI